uniref:Coronin n=1 Tax=Helicotheca tamesis TaxID=374047 RepID=A0A6U0GPC1_9STRA|eukprot:CAMPEP_0185724072 /NCGR_PEP_ID=MMETSP1171-20130828/669_1 /TAXON_ID=374046 /ORGANISM="Helicotheca tamensis, Strain CCMP826" /LENGTH=450 /DNA_ID=CAMNT_0028391847 /DNA_START=42 /DNA_END=1394 /DNA_ORIENTATION=-
MFKLRTSKYRHVFCDAPKPEHTFTGYRLSTVTGDQAYIAASAKYFALSLSGGGGPIGVGRLDRPGRFESGKCPIVQGHKGAVLDLGFSPFDDSMLASASEDTTIKLWSIPENWEPTDEGGNAKAGERLSESLTDLVGHRKKVTLLKFHPTASNVLASTSSDHTVKVWDIEKGEAISTFDEMGDLTQDIVWDVRGDNYATSCKDKIVRIMDARTGTIGSSLDKPHEGLKSVKLAYLGESGKLLSVGASRQSARELKIWDLKMLDKPLLTEKIDTASGVLMPLYDNDTNVVYLCGKGDGIIRPFEFEDKDPYLHRLNDGFRSTTPTKGICMVPKRGLDVMGCETARLLKVTNNQGVHPLSFVVPRKSDAFQDDIFPDCPSTNPAHTADEWLAGSSKPPETMCLNPALAGSNKAGGAPKKKFKTVAQLTKEVDEANKRIEYLEQKLKENSIAF